jgi:hypothetical protein
VIAGLIAAMLISGCGGSDNSSEASGSLTLGLTDAAVANIDQLRLYITGVRVKPENGPAVTYDVDFRDCESIPGVNTECNPVDLLDLQEGIVLTVLSNQEMAAGRYEWLRLEVDSDRSYVFDRSGLTEELTILEVRVPSARGLQLSGGFVILAGQDTRLVMEWDAYQGLTNPVGQEGYILKPTIRVIDTARYGTLMGSVSPVLMGDQCSEQAVVYLFQGETAPDDVDNNYPNPLVTAQVKLREDGSHGYEIHFLEVGTYTATLVCENDVIPVTVEIEAGNDELQFIDPQVRTVNDSETATVDFPAPQ